MSVSEPERHDLYETFVGMVGRKKAETLMALLPPVGWGDIATKRDLEIVEARLSAQIMRTALMVNIPTMLGVAALTFAAGRLG
jgi:hypothetical protein